MTELKLEKASLVAPAGVIDLLREIGVGESGFSGEDGVVAGPLAGRAPAGHFDLMSILRRLVDMDAGRKLPDGFVPMTTFWATDASGSVIGMVRLRHRLNDFLLQYGGHIGYYVARSQRGKGYATAILRRALVEARGLGIERALLTVQSENEASIKVIERNGGVLEDEVVDVTSGKFLRRYWIDLS